MVKAEIKECCARCAFCTQIPHNYFCSRNALIRVYPLNWCEHFKPDLTPDSIYDVFIEEKRRLK